MERTNAAQLESLPEKISFAAIDVSLLPIGRVLPAVKRWMRPDGEIAALIKPQYEAKPDELPPGAVIADPAVHRVILSRVLEGAAALGLPPAGLIRSAIKGQGGNQEFLCRFRLGSGDAEDISRLIAAVCDEC
jgi:23S rRNA (cytidine1920-2'-O)/16S rRNA (cytidine1409-2'-O)-methyltransferase